MPRRPADRSKSRHTNVNKTKTTAGRGSPEHFVHTPIASLPFEIRCCEIISHVGLSLVARMRELKRGTYVRTRCVFMCVLSCTHMLLRVRDIACDRTKNKCRKRDTKISLPPTVERYCSKIRRECQIDSERLFERDKNAFGSSCRDRVSRDNNTATRHNEARASVAYALEPRRANDTKVMT